MKVIIKHTVVFSVLAMVMFCLSSQSVFAQRKGFSAATPESIDDPNVVKCRAGNGWSIAQLVAKGFNFSGQKGAQMIVEEVLQTGGFLPRVITAREAKIDNAAMCRSTNANYILYDPSFFTAVYRDSDEQWADRAIFAHELGHFAHNDDLRAEGSNPTIEREADEYAGEILAKMGAELEQAQAAFRSKRMAAGSHENHPPVKERLAAVEEGWRIVKINKNKQKARQFLDSGLAYNRKQQYDKAIVDLTKAIDIDPTFARAYNGRGVAYVDKKEYDKAIVDYTKAIEIDPAYARAYTNRGVAYYDKKEYDKEFADYTKAIEIDPTFALAYFDRGSAYYDKKEYDRAIADYTKAIEIDPTFALAFKSRGDVYKDKKEYDKAIADYTKAIEIDPTFGDAFYVRGTVYYFKQEYDKAIVDLTKSIEIDPSNASNSYINRGAAYNQKQQYDKAVVDLTKAIEIDPKDAAAYIGRARAYRALGKKELAKLDERKVRDLASH